MKYNNYIIIDDWVGAGVGVGVINKISDDLIPLPNFIII